MPTLRFLSLLSDESALLPAVSSGVTIGVLRAVFVKESKRSAPCAVFSAACSSVSNCSLDSDCDLAFLFLFVA
jgi:hypothetical protein